MTLTGITRRRLLCGDHNALRRHSTPAGSGGREHQLISEMSDMNIAVLFPRRLVAGSVRLSSLKFAVSLKTRIAWQTIVWHNTQDKLCARATAFRLQWIKLSRHSQNKTRYSYFKLYILFYHIVRSHYVWHTVLPAAVLQPAGGGRGPRTSAYRRCTSTMHANLHCGQCSASLTLLLLDTQWIHDHA